MFSVSQFPALQFSVSFPVQRMKPENPETFDVMFHEHPGRSIGAQAGFPGQSSLNETTRFLLLRSLNLYSF